LFRRHLAWALGQDIAQFMTATPKCPKCEGTVFASKTIIPEGSLHKVTLVFCASCGVVVGIQNNSYVSGALASLLKQSGLEPLP
jgi:predicted nucleic-acid-binding Zn-ribbon protein